MAARLSAAGLTPRVMDHHDHICIETEAPDRSAAAASASAASWQALLAVLETAGRFGLVVTSTGGQTVWAAISRKAPATVDAVRGHTHQP
jgi:hypothetical protein